MNYKLNTHAKYNMIENLGGVFIVILFSSYALAVPSKRAFYGKHISHKNLYTKVNRRKEKLTQILK